MPVDIKFCGLTRPADAATAAALGAAYVGVIFAPSPRRLTTEAAAAVLAAAHNETARPSRTGVFAGTVRDDIARTAETLRLDVIQLHGDDDGDLVPWLRERTAARIWRVVHVRPGEERMPPERLAGAFTGDALLVDARVGEQLGGTGTPFDWDVVAEALAPFRTRGPIILAGGLTPDNVATAIVRLAPDVVDVSSGVESSPGIKDQGRMRAFAEAVHGVTHR